MRLEHYVIRGGRSDLERLRLLARVMRPSKLSDDPYVDWLTAAEK
jgi:hypothetical protein